MSFSIAGKTAIVTGAANGIGLAVARHFEQAGANVMFADVDDEALEAELGDLPDDGPVRFFAGDLRKKLTIANLLSATIDAFETIDILVNGSRQTMVSSPLNPLDDGVSKLLEQNLMTSLRLSQAVAKRMIKQAKESGQEEGCIGSIINMSSISAQRIHPELLAHSISSAAVDQMTRGLAVALAPERIRVNSVAFGSVMSASLKKTLREDTELRDDIIAHTPLDRIASAAEIAETFQFLASDAAEFMTGQIVTLDGGRSLLDPVTSFAH
ncbi:MULTISPECIES: SDR family NAD(P)-dependent oxidoreductase [Halocynthiibacter]|uniref:SDR family oxidoreductase n=1 Tax=Halocynthiibacter halioticoli TaxID=2986804 RepID=A0AAE3J174_9RHOB|nr:MULTISPECIES: SDR family oxidoreductase [Halocynthiibacter]MCV6823352.1 SDR family oxidoreductase [Halocynthiibacter halioticoli]MCW4056353.1 SDR family oxidoreductase [Halocynthiibacter sp. SDUM655004]MDE0590681.1 SDR family oxidoreductase [Halocynthiibacter sp. C4]